MKRPPPPPHRRRDAVAIVLASLLAVTIVVSGVVDTVVYGTRLRDALLATVAAPDPPAPSGTGLSAARAIAWGRCSSAELRRLHARCGFLPVPLDWSNPAGTPIRLAVSRIAHTAARSQGVMIVNPGGPGGSGLRTVDVSEDLPSSIAGQYDWIGFDPRGVGDSEPALRCDEHYADGPRPGYSPTPAHVAAWTARAKAYAEACAGNGDLLRHMTTVDSAKDVDALRQALGQRRIDYYGYSYGTYLGQVYATLFPSRVRRMVLDSTEDPRTVDDQYGFGQDEAFEIAMQHYFAWVADWDDVYHLGTTATAVRHRFGVVRNALAAHPEGEVGGAEWVDTFLDAAYAQSDWPDLTDILVAAVRHPDRHDLEDAYETYGVSGDNGYAAYLAVQCTDGRIDPSVPHLLTAVRAEDRVAPYASWSGAWWGLPCNFWPAPAAKRAFRVDGSKVGGVLMLDETLDAATPYSGSLHVRRLFPGARLVAEPGGTSHAETPTAEAPCVTRWIVRYLATGALPARAAGDGPDATCAPPAEPVPNG